MSESLPGLPVQGLWSATSHAGWFLMTLLVAAALGGALGVIRPVRREIAPRSLHVVHAQILLAIVGAVIMVVVAESLARAFAIVGAAGLVRYRAKIKDPKDAGVMLVALAVGLATGAGLMRFAIIATFFVIGVLWVLDSLEPAPHHRFDLKISTAHPAASRPQIEGALRHGGVTFELVGSSRNELHYEVTMPVARKARQVSNLIKDVNGGAGTSIEWEIKKQKV